MESIHGREYSVKIYGLKHLLKRANRLNSLGRQSSAIFGEQSKSAFILKIQVYFFKPFPFVFNGLPADL
jgi:hypothetical protein